MSKLGDYVHYNWQNYRIHGTSKDGFSDFDPTIFAQHRTAIGREILNMKQLSDIKELEKKYNSGVQHLNEFLKETIKSIKDSKGENEFLKQLLHMINKSWDSIADQIIEYIKWDDNRQLIIYDPPVTSAALDKDKAEAKKIVSSFKREKGIHIDVLLNHLNSILTKLDKLQSGDLKTGLIKECKNYIKVLNKGQIGDKELDECIPAITRYSNSAKYKKGFLSVAEEGKIGKSGFLATFLTRIESLTARSASAMSIQNQIGADLAEIMGTVIGQQLNTICKKNITQAFQDFIRSGVSIAGSRTTTALSNGASSTQFYAELDQNFMREVFVSNGDLKKTIKKNKDETGNIFYTIAPLVDKVQQKADFLLQVDDNTSLGVSMKNYDMSDVERYEKGIETPVPNGIHLQDSSLLLYLAGMEKGKSNLGTHYLQVLSRQRGYENGKFATEIQRMRKEAGQALALYILWSAATGRGQGRGVESQFADILAIHDKASSKGNKNFKRIRLYSMRDLLLKLIDPQKLQTYALFSPSITDNKILLDNDRVGEAPSWDDAQKRITSLLMQARAKTIAVSLSKIYLNNFPEII